MCALPVQAGTWPLTPHEGLNFSSLNTSCTVGMSVLVGTSWSTSTGWVWSRAGLGEALVGPRGSAVLVMIAGAAEAVAGWTSGPEATREGLQSQTTWTVIRWVELSRSYSQTCQDLACILFTVFISAQIPPFMNKTYKFRKEVSTCYLRESLCGCRSHHPAAEEGKVSHLQHKFWI